MATGKKVNAGAPVIQEQKVLDSVLTQIDTKVKEFDDSLEWATNPRTMAGILSARIHVDTDRPYFGHFKDKNVSTRSEVFDLRIGLNGVETDPQIVSWEAPIARVYHMLQGEPGKSGNFSISDRREIEISAGEITRIRSSYGFDGQQNQDISVADSTQAAELKTRLTVALESVKTGEFKHIVETIQPDQFTEISRSARGSLALDGVAGSGKTMVGLHRVAYVTSSQREPAERVEIKRVVFLSPTSDLLRWSTKLRKDLRIEEMRFATISRFMWEWLQSIPGVVLDQITSDNAVAVQQNPSRNAVERTSRNIFGLSEIPESLTINPEPLLVDIPYKREISKRMNVADWFRFWSNAPVLAEGELQIKQLGQKPYIDLKVVRESLKNSIATPIEQARIRTVCDYLLLVAPLDITGDVLLLSVDRQRADVHAWLKINYELVVATLKAASWGASNAHYQRIAAIQIRFSDELFHRFEIPVDKLNAPAADATPDGKGHTAKNLSYRDKFRINLLQRGQGLESQFESTTRMKAEFRGRALDPKWKQIAANAIEQYVDQVWRRVPLSTVLPWVVRYDQAEEDCPDRSSLAVLCAAVIQNLNEDDINRKVLSHIVVDEAQELSEAELSFLKDISGNSLTLVGDSAQVMGLGYTADGPPPWIQEREGLEVIQFNRSYRTTAKVTEFCNEILTRRGIGRLAESYSERPGDAVAVVGRDSEEEQDSLIKEWFEGFEAGTGLIVLPEASSAMTRNRIGELLSSIDPQAEARCRVMTPAEARGLEFDHVLVAYVDHGNYPKTEKYGAALYIACTRATATLTCTYFGSASAWLPTNRDA